MLNFSYNIPTRVYFGKNQIINLDKEIKQYNRILFVYGSGSIKRNGIYDYVINTFNKNGKYYKELNGVLPNPRLSSVYEGIRLCRENNIEFILAAGGGSVIDCAKAIAAGAELDEDVWKLFTSKIKIKKALPIGTILTFSATGSEMNGNTVITNEKTKEKLPYGHDLLRPVFSILDPEYTYTMTAEQTAAGVADIMSHIFEQYFSPEEGTYVQNHLSIALLKTCLKYGPLAIKEPKNYEARANLMWASSLALNGILSYGKTGDWATHYIEHELSALYDLTHGVGLAIITPYWMEYVLNDENSHLFATLGESIFSINNGTPIEKAKTTISKIKEFFVSLGLPITLKEVGIGNENFEFMAKEAVKFGPLGSLKKLREEDVLKIYQLAHG